MIMPLNFQIHYKILPPNILTLNEIMSPKFSDSQ